MFDPLFIYLSAGYRKNYRTDFHRTSVSAPNSASTTDHNGFYPRLVTRLAGGRRPGPGRFCIIPAASPPVMVYANVGRHVTMMRKSGRRARSFRSFSVLETLPGTQSFVTSAFTETFIKKLKIHEMSPLRTVIKGFS